MNSSQNLLLSLSEDTFLEFRISSITSHLFIHRVYDVFEQVIGQNITIVISLYN